MNNRDLSKIVEEFKSDPSKNFDLLYRSVYKTIYVMSLTYMKTKEDAEDLTQEAFMKIYKNINSLKSSAAFNSWMNRIVVNSCYRALENKKKNKGNISIDKEDSFKEYKNHNEEEIPDLCLEINETNEVVIEEINKLPIIISEVVMMYYFQHLKVKEISDILNLDESTIKSRLFQGRKKLKLALSEFYYSATKVPAMFIGYKFIGTLIHGTFGEVTLGAGGASCSAVIPKKFNSSSAVAGGAAVAAVVLALVLGGFFIFGGNYPDNQSTNNSNNQQSVVTDPKNDEQKLENEQDEKISESVGFKPEVLAAADPVEITDDNVLADDSTLDNNDETSEEIEVSYITLNRVVNSSAYQTLIKGINLTQVELAAVLSTPGLLPAFNVNGSSISDLNESIDTYHHHGGSGHHHGDDDNGEDEVDNIDHSWYNYYMLFWDVRFDFAYSQIDEDNYEYTYNIAKYDNPESLLNIDLDEDGSADLNIDVDGDGLPELNIDLNGDGKADINIDTDNDGYPEVNIDIDGDWIADINIA